ncbi:response regulator [Croceibacterium sp. TMG7-5b_MA50]|uniref:hybrid sensor histidine kinase/response regulator n=1 Tax=Croceibacterium sp. TMG7-5b_MA50 TaxID=3121290 RepID=UPI003221488A
MSGGADPWAGPGIVAWAAVLLACAASATLLHYVTGSLTLAAAYAGGVLALGTVALVLLHRRLAQPASGEVLLPDWSVTAGVLEAQGATSGVALAVTDRANRLVCANSVYAAAFGATLAPTRLPGEEAATEVLVSATRAAWRDGVGGPVAVTGRKGSAWQVDVSRAGSGEDHLVWCFRPTPVQAPVEVLAGHLPGVLGEVLSAGGVEAALVAGDGTLKVAAPGFARRAAGDAVASLAGQDLASLLRTDERERVYFAREGQAGPAQAMLTVPLADEDGALVLLIDPAAHLAGWSAEAPGQATQLQAILSALPLGLALADREGRLLFANPAFRRAARIEDQPLPSYPTDLVIRQDRAELSAAVRSHAQGAARGSEVTVRLRAGMEEPVTLGLAGVRGLGEAAVLLSLIDSTEQSRLKRQVAQASKMQAIGQLAGGVAHDFNNVLTSIIGQCDLMLMRHLPGDSDYGEIQQIKADANRAASLTRQLLAFSRQQTLQPQVLQLPDVLAEVSQLLRRLLGAHITLDVRHDRDLGLIRADPRQLEQVIVNLAVNARDAIQAKRGDHARGTLSFSTRRIGAADVARMDNQILPPGEYTALIAEDDGGGIPEQLLAKIFEPFFTTKEQGKGTGLGLSTVYGIVKQSGGFIFADNVPGSGAPGTLVRGARFTIFLPVHHPTAEEAERLSAPPAEPEPVPEWHGTARILLVEDEDMVRMVAERALLQKGHEVVTAADGEEGLEALRGALAAGQRFDLVVSDVVMPVMDGPAMVRTMRTLVPDMPVLFMSGYAEAQLREQIDVANMHFLAKPFNVSQIAAMVQNIVATR